MVGDVVGNRAPSLTHLAIQNQLRRTQSRHIPAFRGRSGGPGQIRVSRRPQRVGVVLGLRGEQQGSVNLVIKDGHAILSGKLRHLI